MSGVVTVVLAIFVFITCKVFGNIYMIAVIAIHNAVCIGVFLAFYVREIYYDSTGKMNFLEVSGSLNSQFRRIRVLVHTHSHLSLRRIPRQLPSVRPQPFCSEKNLLPLRKNQHSARCSHYNACSLHHRRSSHWQSEKKMWSFYSKVDIFLGTPSSVELQTETMRGQVMLWKPGIRNNLISHAFLYFFQSRYTSSTDCDVEATSNKTKVLAVPAERKFLAQQS